MPHPLRGLWTSALINDINGQPFDDIEGRDLDLTNIHDDGDMSDCTQGGVRLRSGRAIALTGQAPLKFRILYRTQNRSTHRGFAVESTPGGPIERMVGAFIGAGRVRAPRSEKADDAKAFADQEEATWVATKNP